MGGTDAPSNLIRCTVADHAEFHRVLWEEHQQGWDRIAWLSLSGQVTMSEAKRLVQQEAFRRAGDIARANRNSNGTSIGDWCRKTGFTKNLATPESMRKGGAKVGRMLVESGRFDAIRAKGSIAGGKAAIKSLNAKRLRCLECGVESTPGGIGNHQRGSGHQGKELVCQQS